MPKRLYKFYFNSILERYKKASKKEKTMILTEFCINSGYSRGHANRLLNGKIKPHHSGKKRPARYKYTREDIMHLHFIWTEMNYICSKKMKAALPLWLPHYNCSPETKKKLLAMSSSTIDRRLKPYRGPKKKGQGTTQGLKAMMSKIPLKILGQEHKDPGFVEMDTVAHCGDNIAGDYAHSLSVTDLASGWTENRACWLKTAEAVLGAFKKIEKDLPFKLTGVSSDNGGEFLNDRFCEYLYQRSKDEVVSFVRGRPYRKNDNCYVEQKNYTHVRRLFAYNRYDDQDLVLKMNEIYQAYWSPLQNYFVPNLKLISKERHGSKIKKKYDEGKTPYQRLLDHPKVSREVKRQLRHNLKYHNPFFLKQQLKKALKEFSYLVEVKKKNKLIAS